MKANKNRFYTRGLLIFTCGGSLYCTDSSTLNAEEDPVVEDDVTVAAKEVQYFSEVLGGKKLQKTKPKTVQGYSLAKACVLTYGVQVTHTIQSKEPKHEQGLLFKGSFTVENRGANGWSLQGDNFTIHQVQNDIIAPGAPLGKLAPIHLELTKNGFGVEEVDGPTALWASLGSIPGLTLFFPHLPATNSAEKWPLVVYARGSGMAVEAERGGLELPPNFTPEIKKQAEYDATTERIGWFVVDGKNLNLVRAKWSADNNTSDQNEHMSTETKEMEQSQGDYLYSDDGILVAGLLKRSIDISMTMTVMDMDKENKMDQHQESIAEIRLLEGCNKDALTGTEFAKMSPETQFLETILKLEEAIVKGDESQMSSYFSQNLQQKYGSELSTLLKRHVTRYGPGVFGHPSLGGKVEKEGDNYQVSLVGFAEDYDSSDKKTRMTVHTYIEAVLDEKQHFRILKMGTDTITKDKNWEVLEISAERLFTKAE